MLEARWAIRSQSPLTDITMTSTILARALGCGVEKAATLSFSELQMMLSSRESISDVLLDDKADDFATYEILAIQLLDNLDSKCIEVRILASDGVQELTAYYYGKPE